MSFQSRHYVRYCRFGLAAFVVALIFATAARLPATPLPQTGQHTIHYQVTHRNQPCLDSSAFDSTVPRASFSLLLLPAASRPAMPLDLVTYLDGPSEFGLYNRPPPLR
ncbi:MAG TPA: hypothetical protein VKT29_12020 [Terriglobales bacterium]|nr:hypothetical protein [Terriglobales bacterium]